MRTIYALYRMARPVILLSVMLVYVWGVLMAAALEGIFDPTRAAVGFIVMLIVSVSIHYTNEYADRETDALTVRTPYSGGSGVLTVGLVRPSIALTAAWVTLILGMIGAVIAWAFGLLPPNALILLAIGAFGGWMYSLPPLKLAWRGWGEVDNAVLGGLVLPLFASTVQTRGIDARVFLACLPFTLLVFTNLLATTWSDRRADAQVSKRTLATRLTPSALRALYLGAVALAFVGLIAFGFARPVWSAALFALPFSLYAWTRYGRQESPAPSVIAMIVLLAAHLVGWAVLTL